MGSAKSLTTGLIMSFPIVKFTVQDQNGGRNFRVKLKLPAKKLFPIFLFFFKDFFKTLDIYFSGLLCFLSKVKEEMVAILFPCPPISFPSVALAKQHYQQIKWPAMCFGVFCLCFFFFFIFIASHWGQNQDLTRTLINHN